MDAAVGKPVPLDGYHQLDPAPVWLITAAWILATPVTHLTLLRAHLLTPHRFKCLLAVRRRTGVRLVLVCHHRAVRVFLEREFQQVEHTVAEASALLPEASVLLPEASVLLPEGFVLLSEAGPAAPARRVSEALCPLANRWIGLPVLTTFLADDDPAGAPASAPCRWRPNGACSGR
ncbi:hypothetical protein [Streptomyces sp. NPDC060194]|uniref:hypothetical protein n=1 Tax=Streptomyces sp. NPDC060194 TaxID=3347069 RepID=UPI00365EB7FE